MFEESLKRLTFLPWWVYVAQLLGVGALFLAAWRQLSMRRRLSQLRAALVLCGCIAVLEVAFIVAGGIGFGESQIQSALISRGATADAEVMQVAANGGFRSGSVHPSHRAAVITCSFVDRDGVTRTAKDHEPYLAGEPIPWKRGDVLSIVYDPADPTQVRLSTALSALRESANERMPNIVGELLLIASCWAMPSIVLTRSRRRPVR